LSAETGFKNKQNQDATTIIKNFLNIDGNYLFGVFDGHGVNGSRVSNLASDLIPNNLQKLFSK